VKEFYLKKMKKLEYECQKKETKLVKKRIRIENIRLIMEQENKELTSKSDKGKLFLELVEAKTNLTMSNERCQQLESN